MGREIRRVCQLDRRRAIWRLPEFQTDYGLYKSLESEAEITLKEIDLGKKWGYSIENIRQADRLAEQKERDSPAIRQVTSISRNPIVKFVHNNGDKKEEFFIGDYLYLEIDIQRPDKELQKEFLQIIKACKSELPPGRIRSSNLDIWVIYDARHSNPPRNTQEIIIDIYGKNYNVGKYQKTYEKQIERAIEKAEQIIEFVKEKAPLIEMK